MIRPGDLETRPPLVGESLDGYVAEITAMNDLVRVARISRAGGVEYAHRPRLATQGWDDLPTLAELLEVPLEELRLRAYPGDEPSPTRRGFFGTTVHGQDIRTRKRFFAPEALAASGHHRALWQLRFPFDFDTGEILLDACPRCSTVQRWRHSVGVRYCDVCVEDLAGADTTRIGRAVLDDALPALNLVNPDPRLRAEAVCVLPERFQAVDPGLVLELVLRLVPIADPDLRWSHATRCWANEPGRLAVGIARARTLLADWPTKVHGRISEILIGGRTRYSDGNGGKTCMFLRGRDGITLPPFISGAIGEIHETMSLTGANAGSLQQDTIGIKEASRIIGYPERPLSEIRRAGGLRTIAVMRQAIIVPHLDRREVRRVREDISRRRDLNGTLSLTGLPLYGLEQVASFGDLGILDHPYFGLRYAQIQTTDEHLQELIDRLAAGGDAAIEDAVPIVQAMRAVRGGLKPWGAAINAMLAGRLRYRVEPDRSNVTMRSILVRTDELAEIVAGGPLKGPRAVAFSAKLSKREAGETLNIAAREYTELFSDLPTAMLPVVDVTRVEETAAAFISPLEIVARTRRTLNQVLIDARHARLTRSSPAGYPRAAAEDGLGVTKA